MNKYFLSFMSILILFQSFKVFDEIFSNQDNPKYNFVITKEKNINKEEIVNDIILSKEDFQRVFAEANVEKGEGISRQCINCHDLSNSLKIKVGPPLWGIIDKSSGGVETFQYSKALYNFKKKWSKYELFLFIENPKEYLKGTKMIYKGLKKQSDRIDLISYLESLK